MFHSQDLPVASLQYMPAATQQQQHGKIILIANQGLKEKA